MRKRTLLVVLTVILPGVATGVILPGVVSSENVPWPTNEISANNPLTDLVITSHNPTCTALFLNHLGVTRLTDVTPYDSYVYTRADYKSGVDITAVILTSDTNKTVSAILERPDVSVVTAYPSVPPNTTNTERPAPLKTYTNPDVVIVSPGEYEVPYTPCGVISTFQAETIMDQLGWAGSPYPNMTALTEAVAQAAARSDDTRNQTTRSYTTEADLDPWPPIEDRYIGKDGIKYYDGMMSVLIRTNNTTDTWAYLKKNGAHVYMLLTGDTPGGDPLQAYIPPSLVWALLERDEVREVIENNINDFRVYHYGVKNTEGIKFHTNVENWHKHGYNGTGIKIGVVDVGFNLTMAPGELPSVDKKCFPSLGVGCLLQSESSSDNAHGTAVAEIVMDMAPGADLYLARLEGNLPEHVHEVVDFFIDNNINIIVMAVGYRFEGPGDGTSSFGKSREKSVMYAVDRAIENGTLWVAAGGNFADGENWATKLVPQQLDKNRYIIFNFDDTATPSLWKTENRYYTKSGEERPITGVWMRWYGEGHIDIEASDGHGNITRIGQIDGAPIKFFYMEDGSGTVKLKVRDGSIPKWVQMVLGDNEWIWTYNTVASSLESPAESNNAGLLSVGAQDTGETQQAGYSSRGPTADGRIKPDILGAATVTTKSHGIFSGTSAAAPHIAGMAALVLDYYTSNGINSGPETVAAYLKTHATNSDNPHNNYGWGKATLPILDTPKSKPANNPISLAFGTTFSNMTLHQRHADLAGASRLVAIKDQDISDTIYWQGTSSNATVVTVSTPYQKTTMPRIMAYAADMMTLSAHNAGTATITLNITDGTDLKTYNFGVTVTDNKAPLVSSAGTYRHILQNVMKYVQFDANDDDDVPVEWEFYVKGEGSDLELDASWTCKKASTGKTHVIYKCTPNPGNPRNPGAVSAGASLPINTVTLDITPKVVGTNTILAIAKDKHGAWGYTVTDIESVATNTDPVVLIASNVQVRRGETSAVPLRATDPDGDVILFKSPFSSNQLSASAYIPISSINDAGATGTTAATPLVDKFMIDEFIVKNNTLTSIIVSKLSSHGHTIKYAVNTTTGLLSAIPYSISTQYHYERSKSPSTGNAVIMVSGLAVGNTTVTARVVDVWGGSGTQNFTVTVLPALPVITLSGPTNTTIPLGTVYVEPGYNATDDTGANITQSVVVSGVVNTTKLGTYTISYDVTDRFNGTATTQNRTIHVVLDRVMPVIVLSGSTNMTISAGSTYAEPGYSAIDNIDANITRNVIVSGVVNTTKLGTYTISYDVTDSSGNKATTQNRTIHVVPDKVRPVIVLSDSTNMTVSLGSKYVEPGYSAADDVDGDITQNVMVSGVVNTTKLGTYVISYDVTDSSGNKATTQNRTIHVADVTKPVIVLSGTTEIVLEYRAIYHEPGYSATDDVDGDITGKVKVTGANIDGRVIGTYTISYDVTDSSGNAATTQNRTVRVADIVRPVITLVDSINITITAGSVYTEPGYSAADDVDGVITGKVNVTGTVNINKPGAYTISYDVTDSSGNKATTQNRTVHVVDNTKPFITLSGSANMTVSFGSAYVEPGYSATDNVDGNITQNVTVSGTVNTDVLDVYTISYDVTDSSGNVATTQNRTIHVADRTAPLITLSGSANMTVSFGSAYVEPGYSATDNVDGNVTQNVTVSGTVNTDVLDVYTISYDVTDSSGNVAATQNRTIHVADRTAPLITLSGSANMTVSFGSAYVEPGYSATDNVDGNVTQNVTVSGTVNTGTPGTYTISYDVADSSGNKATTQNRTISVVDNTKPVIVLSGPANMTVYAGSAYAEPGYSATDNVDGNVTQNVTVSGTVNTGTPGTYTISYDVADSSGNKATTQNRTISVVDNTKPVIVLSGPANMTVYAGSAYAEPGYSATDNVDGNVTQSVTVSGTVNSTKLGTYTISYDVTDSSGNKATTQNRTISVVDNTKPVIVLSGPANMTVSFGSAYVEPGYSATDNIDGNITQNVMVSGTVNSTKLDTYIISYDVADSSGNKATTQNRTISVVDNTKPVIVLSGPTEIVLNPGVRFQEPGYSATDNVDGDITAKVTTKWTATVTSGTFIYTYDVTDNAGNHAVQQTRTVTFLD